MTNFQYKLSIILNKLWDWCFKDKIRSTKQNEKPKVTMYLNYSEVSKLKKLLANNIYKIESITKIDQVR